MSESLTEKPVVKVIKFEDRYLTETIDVLGHIWKTLDFSQRMKLFVWRYLENPYLGEHFVFIALVDERVIGIAPYVTLKFHFGNEVKYVLSAADTVIHPDFQGVGAYGKMASYAMDYVKENNERLKVACYLNLSSNHLSTPMCIKLGWTKLLPRDYLYKFSITGFIRTALRIRTNPATKEIAQYRFETDSSPRITEMIGINDVLKSPIRSVRDNDFYSWHYRNGSFLFVYAYKGNDLSAYIVLQKSSEYQYMVLEWVSDSLPTLVKAFRYATCSMAIPITRLYFMNLNPTEREVLLSSGFVAIPKLLNKLGKVNRYPALIRPVDLNMGSEKLIVKGVNPMLPANWSIMRIDVF